jgi:hypothetical protein
VLVHGLWPARFLGKNASPIAESASVLYCAAATQPMQLLGPGFRINSGTVWESKHVQRDVRAAGFLQRSARQRIEQLSFYLSPARDLRDLSRRDRPSVRIRSTARRHSVNRW